MTPAFAGGPATPSANTAGRSSFVNRFQKRREEKMKKHLSKKRVVLAAIVVVALAIASGVAYAYFTATGAGTGNATVGSSAGLTITSTAVSGLYPGGADVSVPVQVVNGTNANEYVNVLSGTVATNGGCLTAWFVVDSKTVTTAVNKGATLNTNTNVRMLDSGTDQTLACAGKTMTINWSST
jgi:hypothetical protein